MSRFPYRPEEEPDAKGLALIEAEGHKAIALSGNSKDEAWCRELLEAPSVGWAASMFWSLMPPGSTPGEDRGSIDR